MTADNELEQRRAQAIEALGEDLTGLAGGEGLSNYVEGHGFQSRVFRFAWEEPALTVDFELPCERILSSQETQTAQELELNAALRMALLLLLAAKEGTLLGEGEQHLSVFHDGETASWRITDAEGEALDAAEDWSALVARLASSVPENSATIIWP